MELQLNSLKLKAKSLRSDEIASLIYHDIFDYPLTQGELIKWKAGHRVIKHKQSLALRAQSLAISHRDGLYFLKGREGIVYKRVLRERISKRKLLIAKLAVKILRFIPAIKMIGITGALAMQNADENSDIDLVIITKRGTLWTTRLFSYLVTWLLGIKTRKPKDNDQKDKLCLNIWLDESALIWTKKDRNIYTAHEIAQIIPLVNRDKIYEKFLYKNKWIKEYWPNAVRISSMQHVAGSRERKTILHVTSYLLLKVVEQLAFRLQYQYMKSKMTREVVTKNRAIFHPNDWGKVVINRFQIRTP